MRASFVLFAYLTCFTATSAFAQWQWIDEYGRNTYSDRPPPTHIPEKNILKAPAWAHTVSPATLPKADIPAEPVVTPPPASNEVTPQDLQQQKQEAARQAAEEKQRKEAQAKLLQQRQENCNRAQAALRTLQADVPLAQIGPDGQRTTMSDLQRQQDIRRVQEVMARDCGPLPKD
ncbi:Uncharacterised protein [uncultured Comamonas sp.]|nr:Uncharacterised protein [uncultured Comamonas sp.]